MNEYARGAPAACGVAGPGSGTPCLKDGRRNEGELHPLLASEVAGLPMCDWYDASESFVRGRDASEDRVDDVEVEVEAVRRWVWAPWEARAGSSSAAGIREDVGRDALRAEREQRVM